MRVFEVFEVFEVLDVADTRGAFQVDVTAWSQGLSVDVGGQGVVSHVGSGLLRLAADRVGLTGALSAALARSGFWPVHDRGRVLADLAVAITDGATTISEIDTLRHQGELFGSVASDTTVWRALEEITPARLDKIAVGWRPGRCRTGVSTAAARDRRGRNRSR
ncbi:MAG: hypothetical protein ACRDTD_32515 [Pseudonocardiaceae bacterium]